MQDNNGSTAPDNNYGGGEGAECHQSFTELEWIRWKKDNNEIDNSYHESKLLYLKSV